MQASNIPTKIPLPFAYNATATYKRSIPAASQIGITAGAASLNDGFPPVTFTPTGSGGVPPFGQDMNGILYEITALQQWQQAGGFFPFDSAFSALAGGYPNGAIVQSSAFNGFWLSTADNNSNNPDTGGANWIPLLFKGVTNVSTTGGTITLSNLQAAYPIIIITGTLTSNSIIVLPTYAQQWVVFNNTSGAYTLSVKTLAGTGVAIIQGSSQHVFGDGTNINQAIPYYALLNSPVFTGTPQAPTQAISDNSTSIASTAFVKAAVTTETTRAEAAENLLAPIASPVFTGTPQAPTPVTSDNSQTLATTSWVRAAMANIISSAGFSYSFTSNGYIKFPSWLGGWIAQWGSGTTTTSTSTTLSLPIAFPTSAVQVISGAAGTANNLVQSGAITNTTLTINTGSSYGGIGFSYIIIGY